jgi:hypothetical protein
MKVLKTIAAVALLLAARPASALVDVSAFGGFTTFNMQDVNQQLSQYAGLLETAYGLHLEENTRITGGYYAGVDGLFTIMPGLKVGPRLEYLAANTAMLKMNLTDEARFDVAMLLAEAGVSTELPLSKGFSLQLGLWLGYGLAYSSISTAQAGYFPKVNNLSGQDPLGEVTAKIQYQVSRLISVGLDLGLRVANVRHMFYTADDLNSGIKSGDVLRSFDDPDKDLIFDFGGKNIGLDINFSF